MSTNTFKKKIKQKEKSSSKKGWNPFVWIEEKLKVSELLGEGIPVNLVPPFLYAACLALMYIWSNHRAENTIRKIEKVQQEVEDLRADVTTLEAEYMLSSKQSEVARKIEPLGLFEIDQPPIKIKVKK
ncbi:FtsL-like putative cell division protein [Pararhodonellum marinum]|uniref:FtsL-like putative cell division protein n=1 Tax=Pararhodonellum marinum TaxID=2755358 RepID=UPI0018905DB6|nr:FtsL-like putative cell division protein [Pararhodonellum marinum]